jgi:hypothetical protein
MRSLNDFIIKPRGNRYNNSVDIGDKSLILNTEIFNHEYINREAEVISTPINYNGSLKVGDIIIVHHNIFRRWHDVKGRERNSRSYFEEDKYFVKEDQIFAYRRLQNWSRYKESKWKAMDGYCFVQPIKNRNIFSEDKEEQCIGIVKYTDGEFQIGELVGFTPFSTYEFVIDGKRLYRVMNKFITIKYEYQGNEEKYNPSWA